MDSSSPRYGFEIRTAHGFFKKLKEDFEELMREPYSSRYAMNCAMTAWHLNEWVWALNLKGNYAEQKCLFGSIFRNKGEFLRHVICACPELEMIQAICNGSKHLGTSTAEVIKETSVTMDNFWPVPGEEYVRADYEYVTVTLKDGRVVRFTEVVGAVVWFWEQKLGRYYPLLH